MHVKLVKADNENADCMMWRGWRNDQTTRRMSRDQRILTMQEAREKFNGYFNDPPLPPLWAKIGSQYVGFLYFKDIGGFVEISIVVNPDCRGLGYSTEIIKRATYHILHEREGYFGVVAFIKEENIRSILAFHKAGYKYLETIDKMHKFVYRG
jgi:RimJ/RimL family protein N-acetyltransferase